MKLTWDKVGERLFETGIDRGVLYPSNSMGVAWNGLVSVSEAPSGGEITPHYIDGVKFRQDSTLTEFAGSIEAYTYPDEFEECDGTSHDEHGIGYASQPNVPFGLSYRTRVGNDILGVDYGYKLHLVYNALATPSQRAHKTMNSVASAPTFNWSFTTVPVFVPGRRPTAHLILDSTRIDRLRMLEIESVLYGSDATMPKLPSPTELVAIFGWDLFQVVPRTTTGMAELSPQGDPDLKDDMAADGLYTTSAETRLVPTIHPGLYNREAV